MIEGITVYDVLAVSTIIFFVGIFGFVTRKNLISLLISIELMLNAVALNFVIFNKFLYPGHIQGYIFSLFLIAVAAAEVALAIAIIISLYRMDNSVDADDMDTLKG